MAGRMLRFLIHLNLGFVNGDRCVYLLSSTYHDQVAEDAFLLLLYTFSSFVKDLVFLGVWLNIMAFDSINLVYLSIFVPIPGCFQYYSFVVPLKIKGGDDNRIFDVVQGFIFAILGLLLFHSKLSMILPRSVKYCAGVLVGTSLHL